MKAEIILVGTELLLGQISDTNGAFLASKLAELGIDLYHIQVVGDNPGRMEMVIKQAWLRADILIITGGLGPTGDDLTREISAKVLNEPLCFSEEAWAAIENMFKKRSRPISENNKKQALFPKSAEIIKNQWGTAPGLWINKKGKIIIALPGVPREMENMFVIEVIPKIKTLGIPVEMVYSKILRLSGIGESAAEAKIKDLIEKQTNPTIAPYAGSKEVILRISTKAKDEESALSVIKPVEKEILKRLGQYCYGFDNESLGEAVIKLLRQKKMKLSVAESCSGGLLSHLITNLPGVSDTYMGGIIAYDNTIKTNLLAVSENILKAQGAVSQETAAAMAAGVKKVFNTDVGIGITGIAGPGGGSDSKPVGLVYIGMAINNEVYCEKHTFVWQREDNKEAAAYTALHMLWGYLKNL